MTGGTIDLALDMDPVRKDDKGREFIHPLPWNFFIIFYISDDLYRLGPLTDRIGRVASSAEFDIWNSCDTIFLHVSMAKVAVQLGDFLMVDVIKADGLINRCTSEDRKDGKDKGFRLDPETIPCNGCDKQNQGDHHQKANLLFHVFSLFASLRICQVKIGSTVRTEQSIRRQEKKDKDGIHVQLREGRS